MLRFVRVRITYRSGIDRSSKRTVICNNCTGAMVLHDFGLSFQSPFVNLFIHPDDYIKILKNIKYYCSLDADIKDVTYGEKYPKMLINNSVIIHMRHYKTFQEAIDKWKERCGRIDYDNLYIIMVKRDGCSINQLKEFDSLNYNHKILITPTQYGLKSEFVIPDCKENEDVGLITDFKGYSGKRYYDLIDWKSFFNL